MISESFVTYSIRQCLSECLDKAMISSLEIVATAIKEVIGKLDNPMQLAIIGKVSSSKSTLVNAILGKAEIVGMGQMEKTYNVCWLKYGSSNKDVKAVLKNGEYLMIPRKDWEIRDNPESTVPKEDIEYYEVTYEHEILKSINIIDTPGLDSVKGTDSRNTINFLRNIRPDAVILLFTKALAESTLSVVRDFQMHEGLSFTISPLNAIGLLSKTDYLWNIDDEIRPNLKAVRDIINGNIYKLFPEVKNTLFTILPICSMLGLASKTINQNDISALNRLSSCVLNDNLTDILSNPDDFLEGCQADMLTQDERKNLYRKFGLYGIFEAIKLGHKVTLDKKNLSSLFRNISGLGDFESCLYAHFSHRSILIKTQNAGTIISAACDRQRQSCTQDLSLRSIVDSIQNDVLTCLMKIFEYKQLDYLKRIYENGMNINNEIALEEYKRVCGENGASAVDKLGMTGQPPVDAMMALAQKRSAEWNYEYQCTYYRSLTDSELYKMLALSYEMLHKDIKEVYEKMSNAEKVISTAKTFLYGK